MAGLLPDYLYRRHTAHWWLSFMQGWGWLRLPILSIFFPSSVACKELVQSCDDQTYLKWLIISINEGNMRSSFPGTWPTGSIQCVSVMLYLSVALDFLCCIPIHLFHWFVCISPTLLWPPEVPLYLNFSRYPLKRVALSRLAERWIKLT